MYNCDKCEICVHKTCILKAKLKSKNHLLYHIIFIVHNQNVNYFPIFNDNSDYHQSVVIIRWHQTSMAAAWVHGIFNWSTCNTMTGSYALHMLYVSVPKKSCTRGISSKSLGFCDNQSATNENQSSNDLIGR